MDYSIIVPLYNEEKNVKLLNKDLVHSIIELKKTKENEFQLIDNVPLSRIKSFFNHADVLFLSLKKK